MDKPEGWTRASCHCIVMHSRRVCGCGCPACNIAKRWNGELMDEQNCANRAITKVKGEKRQSYGDIRQSFENVAAKWTVTLRAKLGDNFIDAEEVAIMMIDFKTVREAHKHQEDNLDDIVGYTLCLEQLRRTQDGKE